MGEYLKVCLNCLSVEIGMNEPTEPLLNKRDISKIYSVTREHSAGVEST